VNFTSSNGTAICSATTGADGMAACVGTIQGVLSLGYDAKFAGDELYKPSQAHGSLAAVAGTPTPTPTPTPAPTSPCSGKQPTVRVSPSALRPGDTATVTGTCFAPNEGVDVAFQSTAVSLGKAVADPDGAFTLGVTIPSSAETGAHQLVVTNASGLPTTPAAVGVRVLGATAPAPISSAVPISPTPAPATASLPLTGFAVQRLLLFGLLLLGVGGALVFGARS
jgi:hypothetical protein